MTPPAHEVSSLPADVLAAYPARYFIETGTNTGKGVDVALAHQPPYDAVWSCEQDETLFRAAYPRFYAVERARLILDDSPAFLRSLLARIPGTAFIYLDAHTEDSNPLLEELAVIAAAPRHDHIIAIDDVRMFGRREMPGWTPVTLLAVMQALGRINPWYRCLYHDTVNGPGDLLVAVPGEP